MRLRRSFTLVVLLLTLLAGIAAEASPAAPRKKKHKRAKTSQTVAGKTTVQADEPEPVLSRKERKRKNREERKKQKEERRLRAAQENKETGQKESSRKNKRKKQPKGAKEVIVAHKKKQELVYPPTQVKNTYRIDVFIPLYLDELVKDDAVTFKDKMPEKAVQGVTFCQGLKLAADSLKKSGFNLDIYIHDAASHTESPESLVGDHQLDSTDLIIGAVPAHDIPALAAYARKKKVNFVSALSPNDGSVRNNQYFTILQPTLKSHCEYIVDDLSKKYPGQKVALLYRTAATNEENAAGYLRADDFSQVDFKPLLCNTLPDREELLSVIDSSRPNIVVIPVLDITFADSLLKQLVRDFPGTHFEVYGMPSWNTIANLRKANAYNNLTVNVTYPFSVGQSDDGLASSLDKAYKKEYGGKITEMVFHGYETLYWYAWLLTRYGTIFNTSYKDNSAAPFTRFDVKPRWDNNGNLLYNENRHIYLSTYQAGVYRTE